MNKKSHPDGLEKIDILLVDDRRENLLSLEAVLACAEYNLIKTTSGYEALRYLLDHTPALILLDVQMPELNGFETASIIKSSERTREIPIIFVTAINKDQQFVHQGYDHGAVDYIYKPYDIHILKAKVAIFVDIRRQHNRISRLVSVQQAATTSLADFTQIDTAISNVLESICTSLRWDLGLFWRVDAQTQTLYCRSEWHDPTYSSSDFAKGCFKQNLSRGVGLPGRVWENKKALWVTELLKETAFPGLIAATKENLHTAAALPIYVQDETMGVLEFYSRNSLSEDPDLVNIMSAIGSQVGQVLKRTETLELIQDSEARLAAIAIENAKLYQEAQEAIQVRDDFFSIASHELKTPITALKMMIQIIQRTLKPEAGALSSGEKLFKMLDASSKQINRLTHLVEDLLDVVKIRAGKLSFNVEEVNLSDLVKEIADQHCDPLAAAKCPLKLKIEPNIKGHWDYSRIEQILVNLLSNAIKYAPGNPIKIEVSRIDHTAKLVVQDSGPGIPKEQQPKIFNRFERALASQNISGLGLGLFIVKQIVEAHHGTIHLESEVGTGSSFIVELPTKILDATLPNPKMPEGHLPAVAS